jgi:hypothetical protein
MSFQHFPQHFPIWIERSVEMRPDSNFDLLFPKIAIAERTAQIPLQEA